MKALHKVLPVIKSFYFIVGIIAAVWILFFDRYNFMDRLKTEIRIKELRADLKFFRAERDNIEETRDMMESDMGEIERFARERYMMKRDNEDLFLITSEH